MSIDHPATMIAGTVNENNITLFVSLELSKSSWLVTANSPGVEKRSKHAVTAGDGGALLDLLARLKSKGERRIGTASGSSSFRRPGWTGFGSTVCSKPLASRVTSSIRPRSRSTGGIGEPRRIPLMAKRSCGR